MDKQDISFRMLQRDDMHRMYRWLNEPHVREWYDAEEPGDAESIQERYLPFIHGEGAVQAYIIVYRGDPIGYIQSYNLRDDPEEMQALGVDEHAAGIDLFIGEPASIGRGIGPVVIQRFLQEKVFSQHGIDSCVIDPETGNTRAIRAYEKLGFKYIRTLKSADEPRKIYLMRLHKSAFISE